MFTKNTIALNPLERHRRRLRGNEQQSPTPPERVYINNPPPTWQ
jgi:hypothetical protein